MRQSQVNTLIRFTKPCKHSDFNKIHQIATKQLHKVNRSPQQVSYLPGESTPKSVISSTASPSPNLEGSTINTQQRLVKGSKISFRISINNSRPDAAELCNFPNFGGEFSLFRSSCNKTLTALRIYII